MFANEYDITARPTEPYKHSPVETAQIGWELMRLVELYVAMAPLNVLEIGTYKGGTLYHWLTNAVEGADVVGIDQGKEYWQPPAPDFDESQFMDWVPVGVAYTPIRGDSHLLSTLQRVKEVMKAVDFLFIDGDHSYEGVKKDFELYGPLVRKGGIIAFHDLVAPEFSPHIQVWQLWREIQAAGYKTREIRAGAEWGGIGVVFV